jgi:spore maturation protein CgeB
VGSLDARYLDCELPCVGALRLVRERFLKLKAEQPCVPFEELLAAAAGGLAPEDYRAFTQTADYARFVGDLLQQADARYRLQAVRRAAATGPLCVFGNADWAARLPASASFAGALEYGRSLADVYRASAINLNLTNSHLQTAVNQRVFDCPAAGGFLLTDYRADIERFFEPGREIVCFKTLEEMAGLLERYGQSSRERQSIALAAQRRVLAEHTWDCRMRTMIGMLRGSK